MKRFRYIFLCQSARHCSSNVSSRGSVRGCQTEFN